MREIPRMLAMKSNRWLFTGLLMAGVLLMATRSVRAQDEAARAGQWSPEQARAIATVVAITLASVGFFHFMLMSSIA